MKVYLQYNTLVYNKNILSMVIAKNLVKPITTTFIATKLKSYKLFWYPSFKYVKTKQLNLLLNISISLKMIGQYRETNFTHVHNIAYSNSITVDSIVNSTNYWITFLSLHLFLEYGYLSFWSTSKYSMSKLMILETGLSRELRKSYR